LILVVSHPALALRVGAAVAVSPRRRRCLTTVSWSNVAEGVVVVATPEEIDVTNAEALRSALLTAAARRPGTLVVDMTRTQFCDSSGPHALFAAHQQAEAEDRQVLMVISEPIVRRIFALTGVGRLIPTFTSLAECRSALIRS
jgi:anti-sigma B factor antagonist